MFAIYPSLPSAPPTESAAANGPAAEGSAARPLLPQLDRFQLFLEHAEDIVYSLDMQGCFLYVSPNWQKHTGEPLESAIGKSFAHWVHPADLPAIQAFFQQVTTQEGSRRKVDYRARTASGNWGWYNTTGSCYIDPETGEKVYWGIARDVSELKQAHERYQQIYATLRSLRNIDKAITSERDPRLLAQEVCDSLTSGGQFASAQIVQVDLWGRLVSIASSGDAGINLPQLWQEYREQMPATAPGRDRLALVEKLLNRHLPCPINGYYLAREGLSAFTRPLQGLDRTLGYFSVCVPPETLRNGLEIDLFSELAVDIAYALQSIENQRLNLRLAAAIEQCGDAIIITDTQPAIEYVNPAFEKMTGYSAAEVLHRNPSMLQSGEHDDTFYHELWANLNAGRIWSGHLRNRTKAGHLLIQDTIISPIKDYRSQITGFVAITKDITERTKWESSLLNAQKLQAIGTMAGGIAHDFNNILTGILGNLSYLKKYELEPDHPGQESVQNTLDAVDRARLLIEQILQFSRPNREEIVRVRAAPVIEELFRLLRSTTPGDVQLIFANAAADDHFMGSASKYYQVILNLCTNAIQAVGKQPGLIEISLSEEHVAKNAAAHLPDLPTGDYLVTTVRDTGCGMPDSIRSRIFDPFFTTREQPSGSGLGLTVVHNIVRGFNGIIRVESTPGRGSTFFIYLPKA